MAVTGPATLNELPIRLTDNHYSSTQVWFDPSPISILFPGDGVGRLRTSGREESVHGRGPNHAWPIGSEQDGDRLVQAVRHVGLGKSSRAQPVPSLLARQSRLDQAVTPPPTWPFVNYPFPECTFPYPLCKIDLSPLVKLPRQSRLPFFKVVTSPFSTTKLKYLQWHNVYYFHIV